MRRNKGTAAAEGSLSRAIREATEKRGALSKLIGQVEQEVREFLQEYEREDRLAGKSAPKGGK